jgi:predicted nucleotidyltransferase
MKQETLRVIPLEGELAKNKILRWFFAYPESEFSLNDVAFATKISKTSARTAVEELLEEKILTRTIIGKLWRLRANIIPSFMQLKIVHSLLLTYRSGIINQVLARHPQTRSITLFGSFRKGDDISTSDLDLAIEIPGTKETLVKSFTTIKPFDYRKSVEVNIHIFSRKNVDLNVFANIANGIIIHGFLEVKP